LVKQLARVAVSAAVVLGLAGCASIEVRKPDINAVKKIAIVSVTSNYRIRDVKEKERAQADGDLGQLGMSLADAVIKGSRSDAIKAQVQVVTHGAAELSAMFSKINGWTILPVGDVIANPAYAEMFAPKQGGGKVDGPIAGLLQGAASADWVVPEGMGTLPLASVVPGKGAGKTVSFVNGKRVANPTEEARADLGRLCAELGVDAVVVAEVKLSYTKAFLTGISGGGLLGIGKTRSTRKPVVEANVAIVDSKGQLVVATKPGWKAVEGDPAPMLLGNEVDLADDKGECVKQYNAAIDASVKELEGMIAKALL
jgi:hypothetical protein